MSEVSGLGAVPAHVMFTFLLFQILKIHFHFPMGRGSELGCVRHNDTRFGHGKHYFIPINGKPKN